MLKAVIFDFDGTLADTLPLCIKAFRMAIEPHLSRTVSDEEIIATFGPSEEGTIKSLIPDRFDEGLSAYHEYYTSYHSEVPTLFEGVEELLALLRQRGVRLALVTGKALKSALISLDFYRIKDCFEQIGHGDLTKGHKAKNIRRILTEWGLEPDEVVYVGDAPSDITACREAGVAIVSAAWAATAEPDLLRSMEPDALLFSVPDLQRWLEAKLAS
ncbi:HAD family hydrolase [Larkinella insperata]|uniref:phosphoglycolate phosphatase n=1 Tax=Larkinella insperata TaxID=332158 RepID=A0ABW3QNE2_9BACT|nr:HAD hydrolase-like protein [Larkinella insperata]